MCGRFQDTTGTIVPPCRSIQRRGPGWTRSPAAMNPKPLVRILTDDLFQMALNTGGIGLLVAADLDRRVESQHVPAFGLRPEGKPGNHRGPAPGSDLGESGKGAG